MTPPTPPQGQLKGQSREQQLQVLADAFIGRCRTLYEAKGNHIHALRAFRIAKHLGISIPDWASAVVDRYLREQLAGSPPTSRGGPSALTRANTEDRNLAVVDLVEHFLTTDPDTFSPDLRAHLNQPDGVFITVGDRMNLSPEHVKDIYYDWLKAERQRAKPR